MPASYVHQSVAAHAADALSLFTSDAERSALLAGAGVTELPVPPEAVSDANCPGDWLLLALLNTYQAAELHSYAAVCSTELTEAPAGLTVHLHCIDGQEDERVEDSVQESAEAPDPQPDVAALAFVYDHGAATVTPSKVTATQLKGRAIDEEIAEGKARAHRRRAGHGHAFGNAVPAAGHTGRAGRGGGGHRRTAAAAAVDAGAGGGAGHTGIGAVFTLAAGAADTYRTAGVAGVPLRAADGRGHL